MQNANLSPGFHHVVPLLALFVTLAGVADGVSWLLVGESFVPPPLCLLPIVIGVLIYRRYAVRAVRRPRFP